MSEVHILLVTGERDSQEMFVFWLSVATLTNVFESRMVPGSETRMTSNCAVGDEHLELVLTAARKCNQTVEKIEHDSGEETYRLLVGEPGTGWERGPIVTTEPEPETPEEV